MPTQHFVKFTAPTGFECPIRIKSVVFVSRLFLICKPIGGELWESPPYINESVAVSVGAVNGDVDVASVGVTAGNIRLKCRHDDIANLRCVAHRSIECDSGVGGCSIFARAPNNGEAVCLLVTSDAYGSTLCIITVLAEDDPDAIE